MVTVKAKENFGGLVTMTKGEAKSVEDWIATDLANAGFVEIVGDENGRNVKHRKSSELSKD